MPQLKVMIEIEPPPSEIHPRDLDALLSGELENFQTWFIARQQRAGNEGAPLVGAERGVVKAYLIYAATARQKAAAASTGEEAA
jgi:hypothetical protein